MIKFRNIMASLLCFMMVSACSIFGSNSPQEYAGINSIKVEWQQGDDGKWSPTIIELLNGKEQSRVELAFEMPDGTVVNYTAGDVKAFTGQEIRGMVEKAWADKIAATLPSMVDAAIVALKKGPVP